MLYLIHRNKVGKNIHSPETQVDWRSLFKASEDSHTSSVFSLLFYLPGDLFWKILYNACYSPCLPEQAGKILSKELWPRWNCDGTRNINYIEPDVFIRFENFDLIIEAKRYDYVEQQSKEQWENQVIAYYNEYDDDPTRPVHLIALAGIMQGSEKQGPIVLIDRKEIHVTICRWKRILHQVHKLLNNRKGLEDSTIFILQDIVIAFRVHGFLTGSLLDSLPADIKIRDQSVFNIARANKLIAFRQFPENVRNIHYNHILKLHGAPFKN